MQHLLFDSDIAILGFGADQSVLDQRPRCGAGNSRHNGISLLVRVDGTIGVNFILQRGIGIDSSLCKNAKLATCNA